MSQKYKIFINEKVLYLVDNPAKVTEIMTSSTPFIIQPFKNEKNLDSLLDILLGDINPSNMVIYHTDVEELKKELFKKFEYIEAAGGLVQNQMGQILIIYRRGFWDLPKGKLDKGESLEEAAIREVKEETGLLSVDLLNPVRFGDLLNECTFHTYPNKGGHIMKASYWYQMTTDEYHELNPQAEEDIEEAIWVDRTKISKYFPKMYPSIVDVLDGAGMK